MLRWAESRRLAALVAVIAVVAVVVPLRAAWAAPDPESASSTEALRTLNENLDAEITRLATDPNLDAVERSLAVARAALGSRRELPLAPAARTALAEQATKLDAAADLLDATGSSLGAVDKAIAMARTANEMQAQLLGIELQPADIHRFPSASEGLRALAARRSIALTPEQSEELTRLDRLDEPLGSAFKTLVDAFVAFDRATVAAYGDADLERARELLGQADTGSLAASAVPAGGPAELLADLGIDLAPLFAARAAFIDAVDVLYDAWTSPQSQSAQTMTPFNLCPLVSVDFAGWNDYYGWSQDCILLVDFAGDDTYDNNAGGSNVSTINGWCGLSLTGAAALVDLLGNDRYGYWGRGCGVNGGGFWGGAGFLFDALGTDQYYAYGYGTNGGGYTGSGFLVDGEGVDQYYGAGGNGTNGGAALGTGTLVDRSTTARFHANGSYGTNGGGALGGVGTLVNGGDGYTEVGSYERGTNGGGCGGSGFLFNAGDVNGGWQQAGTYGTNGGADGGIYEGIVSCGYGSGFALNTAGLANHSGENGGGRSNGVGTFIGGVGPNGYGAPAWGNGAGFSGVGLLVDPWGYGTYWGGNGAGGFRGAGMLIDLGDDTDQAAGYTGDIYGCYDTCNGGGLGAGSGFLYDQLGNDVYSAGSYGTNGGGSFGGAGYLHDTAGVDAYTAGTCGVNGGGYVSTSSCVPFFTATAGSGTLLDTEGTGDTYSDGEGGSGTDTTVAAKGSVGRQLDLPPANTAPTATLVSPVDGHTFGYGAPQSFTVSATDPEGDQWVGRVEVRNAAGTVVSTFATAPTASGQSATATSPVLLPAGTYSWTATATDAKGATSAPTASRGFTVAANQAPAPSQVSPADGASFATGAPVTFTVSATDPESHDWVGRVEVRSGSTVVGTYATPKAASGQSASTAAPATLPPGTYTWTATATDAHGAASAPTGPRTFTVAAPPANGAPTATAVSPAAGHTFAYGAPQSFTVSATDPEGDQWVGRVEVRNGAGTVVSTFATAPTASGQSATATSPVLLPAGTYSWTATATDTKGATSAPTGTRGFTVAANQAPAPSQVSPADGAGFATGAPVTFTVSATDPESHDWVGRVEVRSGSTLVGTYATPKAASGQSASTAAPATLPPGTYTWTATATDAHGAASAPTGPRTFTVATPPPNGAPTATAVSPAAGHTFAYGAPQSFTVSATDPEGDQWVGRVEVRNAAGTVVSTFATAPTASGQSATATSPVLLPAGTYSWTATATDAKGATSAPTASRGFTVAANQAPAPAQVSPADGAGFATGAPVTFTVSATDPESHDWVGRVEVRSGSTVVGTYATPKAASGQSASTAAPATLPPGTYTWTATATDAHGAASAPTGPRTFTVAAPPPNGAPTATAVSPAAGHTFAYGAPQSFTVSATDPEGDQWVGRVEVRNAANTVVSTFATAPTASGQSATATSPVLLPAGTYSWTATATDAKGATSAPTASRGFTVAANQAPAPAQVSPADGASFATGAPVTFTVSATDPESHDWVGRVEVRSGSTVVGTYATPKAASGQSASTAPAATLPPGTYTWTATATDAHGAASAPTAPPRTFTVAAPPPNGAPTVTLISPPHGHTFLHGQEQAFTLSATDPESQQWMGIVEVRDNQNRVVSVFTTPPTSSGAVATTKPPVPLPAGGYTWTAIATDTAGGTSGTPASRGFTVATPDPLTADSAGGLLAFEGTATLPTFPCEPPPPFGTGPCHGDFNGQWSGHLSGLSGTSPYEVTWSAPVGSVSAEFDYAEWQCVGLETVLGFAKGTGTASAGVGEVDGQWQVPGETFARDIVAVDVSFEFEWVRLGNVATLVMKPFSLELTVSGDIGTREVVTDLQAGAAVFVATSTDGIGGPPTCDQPWSQVEGRIAGTVPLRQAPAA